MNLSVPSTSLKLKNVAKMIFTFYSWLCVKCSINFEPSQDVKNFQVYLQEYAPRYKLHPGGNNASGSDVRGAQQQRVQWEGCPLGTTRRGSPAHYSHHHNVLPFFPPRQNA